MLGVIHDALLSVGADASHAYAAVECSQILFRMRAIFRLDLGVMFRVRRFLVFFSLFRLALLVISLLVGQGCRRFCGICPGGVVSENCLTPWASIQTYLACARAAELASKPATPAATKASLSFVIFIMD